jgi:hypothetical protein
MPGQSKELPLTSFLNPAIADDRSTARREGNPPFNIAR